MLLTIGVWGLFLATATAAFAVVDYGLQRRRVRHVLRNLPEVEMRPEDVGARALALPLTQRVLGPGLRSLGARVRRFAPVGALDRLRHQLDQVGNPHGWDAERLFAAKIIAAVVFLGVSGLLASVLDWAGLRLLVLAAIVGFVGYQVPEWLVRSRGAERQQTIRRALPDTLDLLSITVQAGLGFDAAVSRVADQSEGPLGDELRRLLREMELGKSRADALRDLGARSDLPELTSFVLAMVQADTFGISIARVLDVQAREMRLKRRQRAEEQAHKVPVKILFPVLLGIFPAMFVVLLGPAVIQLYHALIAT
ncbi:MAG: type II secretion system F family protein [Nitriliruptorales bacterium]